MKKWNFDSDSLEQVRNTKFQSNSLNVLNLEKNPPNFDEMQPQNNNFQKNIHQNMLLKENYAENYQNQVFS